jgi:hypothetical protein
MQASTPDPHPKHSRAMTDEADIGSGEKTPAQLETEKMIQDIPPLPSRGKGEDARKEAGTDVERGAPEASEADRAGHGQVQREQNASRQEADPGMTPDAAV